MKFKEYLTQPIRKPEIQCCININAILFCFCLEEKNGKKFFIIKGKGRFQVYKVYIFLRYKCSFPFKVILQSIINLSSVAVGDSLICRYRKICRYPARLQHINFLLDIRVKNLQSLHRLRTTALIWCRSCNTSQVYIHLLHILVSQNQIYLKNVWCLQLIFIKWAF